MLVSRSERSVLLSSKFQWTRTDKSTSDIFRLFAVILAIICT